MTKKEIIVGFRGLDTPFFKEIEFSAAGNIDEGKVAELSSERDERIKTDNYWIRDLDSIRIRFLLIT